MAPMHFLLDILTNIGYWGYGLVFLIIFLESFPPTFFFPGDSLLFVTGFLASQGHFNLALLIVALFLGSVGGYMFSYAMGQKLRDFILRSNDRYWFKKKHLDYTEEFYKKYGNKTIVIGRFVPIVRSFSPTLAGAVQMNYKKFIKFTLVGGFLWTAGLTLVGFYLGQIIPNADKYISLIVVAIILVSLLPFIWEYTSKMLKKRNERV